MENLIRTSLVSFEFFYIFSDGYFSSEIKHMQHIASKLNRVDSYFGLSYKKLVSRPTGLDMIVSE